MNTKDKKDKTEKSCKNCYYFYKNEINYCEDCRYYGADNYFKPLRAPLREPLREENTPT